MFQRPFPEQRRFLNVLGIVFFSFFILQGVLFAEDPNRSHQFVRSIAMGDAFTAVADGRETIAYNPAGLLQKGVEWSLTFDILSLAYNEMVNDAMAGELEFNTSNTDYLEDLPGTRAYIEIDTGLCYIALCHLYYPNSGVYFGASNNIKLELVFPEQTVIPIVEIEAVAQYIVEYGLAYNLFLPELYIGANFKVIHRYKGFNADISLLRAAALGAGGIQDLESEYNPNPAPAKVVLDLGLIYRIDHPLNPRIGISVLDTAAYSTDGLETGTIDYAGAGESKQLVTMGGAMTQQINEIYLTYSLDYQDLLFGYYSNDSLTRRIAIGFEAAFWKEKNNISPFALQMGLRELKYFSYGFTSTIGFFQFSLARWVENFGSEANPTLDQRYMFDLAFVF